MKTLPDIASLLRETISHQKMTQSELKTRAGISQRTLTNILSGKEDFKVSTLMSVADRLGLDLLLLPKGAARAIDSTEVHHPAVKSRVGAALDRVRMGKLGDGR